MAKQNGTNWALGRQKRSMDLLGITTVMPVFIPYGLYIATKIRKEDDMSPLFSHTRYGLGLAPFTFYKFRTMSPEELPNEPSQGSGDDRRTALGIRLSSKHVDEIPQAINIYNGSMSLVGPRPLVWKDIEQTLDTLSAAEQRDWLAARSSVKPGVFGEFQLRQHDRRYEGVGEEDSIRTRVQADIDYASQVSYTTDKSILVRTALAALNPTGEKTETRGESVVTMLASVAEGMGIVIDKCQRDTWHANLLVARYADDLVDDNKVDNLEEHIFALMRNEPIEGLSETEQSLVRSVYANMTPEKRQEIFSIFLVLPAYANAKRKATNKTELMSIVRAEAKLFAELLHFPNSIDNASQFNAWVNAFADTGYLVDFVLDNKEDYREGNVCFNLRQSQKLLIGGQAVRQSLALSLRTPRDSLRSITYAAAKTLARN